MCYVCAHTFGQVCVYVSVRVKLWFCMVLHSLRCRSSVHICVIRQWAHASHASARACARPQANLCWRFPFEMILLLNLSHLLSIPIGIVVYYTLAADKHD